MLASQKLFRRAHAAARFMYITEGNRARDAARPSGQAVARACDSHTGVEHHHTPPRASGSRVSAVSRSSGQDMADASTPSDPLDWLALGK
eukprot:4073940-Pleurochrysis_carterae.AAC.3